MNDAMYAARRERVFALLGEDSALIVPAAPELTTGPDGHLRYMQDSDLYYLTGYAEPEAVLVMCRKAESPVTVFVRPRDEERERWTGPRAGVDGAREAVGADRALPIDALGAELPALLKCANTLYAPFDSQRRDVEDAVRAALLLGQRNRARTGCGPDTLRNGRTLVGQLRLSKDDTELELLREAARISVAAFTEMAASVDGARGEWALQAAVESGFRTRGAMGPAFPTIVAGGPRATVLHYEMNDQPLHHGELVLVDAGARYRMYCADISRTLPVSGHFTPEQQAMYDVVLHAHDAAIDAVQPGALARDVDDAALRVLVQGMLDLELLTGTIDDIIEKKDYRRYYPHRTSHWLGLDVHDAGDYVLPGGESIALQERFVLTVEPGLYVPADDTAAPSALRGIGIRLEDDVLVTATGHEVLTAALPISAADVAAMVQG